jgi:hypothetical protein
MVFTRLLVLDRQRKTLGLGTAFQAFQTIAVNDNVLTACKSSQVYRHRITANTFGPLSLNGASSGPFG